MTDLDERAPQGVEAGGKKPNTTTPLDEQATRGHIEREARALAACDGHEYDWWDLRPSERERYREEAAEIAMYRRIAERSQVSAPRVREDTETSETEAWFAEHFPSPAAAKTHEYAMPDVAGALLRDCARLIVRFRDLPITVSASPAGQQSARQRLRDEAKRLIERIGPSRADRGADGGADGANRRHPA